MQSRPRNQTSSQTSDQAQLQASVAGYTRIVRWMKVLLPLGALLLIGAIFLIDRRGEESLFSPEELARLGAGMQLEEPRFAGATDAGEPFVVSAARALPDGPVPDIIQLEAPEGRITFADDLVLEGTARTGLLSRDEMELTLTGSVVLRTSDGYRGQTEKLILDIDRRVASAPGRVTGFGPVGSIEAGAMRALRADADAAQDANAMVILFEKGVRVVFIPPEAR